MKYFYLFVCLLMSFNLTAQVNVNNDAAQIDSLIVTAYKIGSQNVVEALENSKKAAKL